MRIEDALAPERDLLLVHQDPETKDLGSGLVAPESSKTSRTSSGKILAAGPEAHPDFHPGRIIYFSPLAGTEIAKGEGETALIMSTSDILCLGGSK